MLEPLAIYLGWVDTNVTYATGGCIHSSESPTIGIEPLDGNYSRYDVSFLVCEALDVTLIDSGFSLLILHADVERLTAIDSLHPGSFSATAGTHKHSSL